MWGTAWEVRGEGAGGDGIDEGAERRTNEHGNAGAVDEYLFIFHMRWHSQPPGERVPIEIFHVNVNPRSAFPLVGGIRSHLATAKSSSPFPSIQTNNDQRSHRQFLPMRCPRISPPSFSRSHQPTHHPILVSSFLKQLRRPPVRCLLPHTLISFAGVPVTRDLRRRHFSRLSVHIDISSCHPSPLLHFPSCIS